MTPDLSIISELATSVFKSLNIIIPILLAGLISVYTVNKFEKRKTEHRMRIELISEIAQFYQDLRISGIRLAESNIDIVKFTEKSYFRNLTKTWVKIKSFGKLYYGPNDSKFGLTAKFQSKKDIRKQVWLENLQFFISAQELLKEQIIEILKLQQQKNLQLDKDEEIIKMRLKYILNKPITEPSDLQETISTILSAGKEELVSNLLSDEDISDLNSSEIEKMLDTLQPDLKKFLDTIDNAMDKLINFVYRTEINL